MTAKIFKLSFSLFIFFIFTGLVSAAVIDKPVYALYHDNIGGAAIIDGNYTGSLSDPNIINMNIWRDWSANLNIAEIEGNSFEGAKHFRLTKTGTWVGWSFTFAASTPVNDMSAYYGGTIEAWIKTADISNSLTGDYEIGVQFRDASNTEVWFTLASLGFNTANPDWQKISIPLTTVQSASFTASNLSYVFAPFCMKDEVWDTPIEIDAIVWKKAGVADNTSFSAELKNRSDNSLADEITWSAGSPRGLHVANQYIELYCSNLVSSAPWSIQIYTNNGTSSGGDGYTGNLAGTATVSGLVSSASDRLVPMFFRTMNRILNDNEIYADNWLDPWGEMKDKASFSAGTGVESGGDLIKVLSSRRGFHVRFNGPKAGDPGYDPASDLWYPFVALNDNVVNPDKVLRIYFMANFSYASFGAYETDTITIECIANE